MNVFIKLKIIKTPNQIIKLIVFFLFIGIILILPKFIKSNYFISVFVNCFIYAALAIAWNLISGYGGQTSWCHSAFVAIGGYVGIIFYNNFGISPFYRCLVC